MACSPVGLSRLMGRMLRPVITKVRIRFMVKPEFFQVGFFNRLGCLFNCEDHIHSHIFIRSSKYGSFHTDIYIQTRLLTQLSISSRRARRFHIKWKGYWRPISILICQCFTILPLAAWDSINLLCFRLFELSTSFFFSGPNNLTAIKTAEGKCRCKKMDYYYMQYWCTNSSLVNRKTRRIKLT